MSHLSRARGGSHGGHTLSKLLRYSGTLALVAGLFAPPAFAEQGLLPLFAAVPRDADGDTLDFAVFELARYDSNLFRLPDGDAPPGPGPRSSWTLTTGAGLHLDKYYGQQRIVLDASVTRDHYTAYDNLDYTGRRIDGTWFWSFTPELTGDVIYQNEKTPTDFEYVGFQRTPDPQKVRLTRLDVDWRAGAALHPRFSIYRRENTNRTATFQLESSRSTSEEFSLIYNFPSENHVEAYVRRANGDSTDNVATTTIFADRDFQEKEYGVRAVWLASGQIYMDGRVGHRQREYSTFSQRDFDGVVGAFDLVYDPTGKIEAKVALERNLYGSETNTASFYVSDSATASVAWAATGKITVRPSYRVRHQDYSGAPIPTKFKLLETTHYTALELDWAAARSVDVFMLVGKSSRNSTVEALQFDDRTASILARLKF